jgi:predicted hydrocarbon binding protein
MSAFLASNEESIMAIAQNELRQELGDFSSIVCLKAIVVGVEEALGEKAAAIAMISAGRQRGKKLAEDLDLAGKGSSMSLEDVTVKVQEALGKDGTRLCVIDKVTQEGDIYKVYTHETVCSAGESQGSSRQCTFTMGAIQGFLEAFLGKRLRGTQTESVLRGGNFDVLEYADLPALNH